MASSWALSWGSSWADSWGSIVVGDPVFIYFTLDLTKEEKSDNLYNIERDMESVESCLEYDTEVNLKDSVLTCSIDGMSLGDWDTSSCFTDNYSDLIAEDSIEVDTHILEL